MPDEARKLTAEAARLLASPTRLEILQNLQIHGQLTPQQLAELASDAPTRNAINRQIAGLLADGLIEIVATHNPAGAGRPERVLALSAQHDWTGLVDEINARAQRIPERS